MKNQLDGKDPLGKIIRNVNIAIGAFGLVGILILIWMFSSFFIEGC